MFMNMKYTVMYRTPCSDDDGFLKKNLNNFFYFTCCGKIFNFYGMPGIHETRIL